MAAKFQFAGLYRVAAAPTLSRAIRKTPVSRVAKSEGDEATKEVLSGGIDKAKPKTGARQGGGNPPPDP